MNAWTALRLLVRARFRKNKIVAEFLVCYDYGQGGVWLYLKAGTAADITDRYPALTVFETPPDWWTDEMERQARVNDATSPFWHDWLTKLER
jgi:hypothetical protein